MAKDGLKEKYNGFKDPKGIIAQMVKAASDPRGFLTRVAYPAYQNAQRERWMTEGASQGNKWKPLNKMYREYKLRRYGGGTKYAWIGGQGQGRPWQPAGKWPTYPGKGSKMMVATNTLMPSVTGDSTKNHRRIIDARSMKIFTTVDYAEQADNARSFTIFKSSFSRDLQAEYESYVARGGKIK